MHRRQVGEWKSIIKTGLQGRRITLGYFSWFSESRLVNYSHSPGTTLGSSPGQEETHSMRWWQKEGGVCFKAGKKVEKQQLLQDDKYNKMPPG